MQTIVDYIEKLKETYNLTSYYKAMEFIGMGVQGWTKIKAGGGISEKNAIRLAQALKIDPIEIMAVSNALKAENKEIKMIWLKLAKQKEDERIKKKLEFEEEERKFQWKSITEDLMKSTNNGTKGQYYLPLSFNFGYTVALFG